MTQDSEDFSKQFGVNVTSSQISGTLSSRINSYLPSNRTMDDSKTLFDYWHDRVRLRNPETIAAPSHVQTQTLRHECTNYDDLWRSPAVQRLDEPERSKVIAIIKYECTTQVLQNRAGRLRDHANELEEACYERDQQKSRLLSLIRALQGKLFGKDREIERLETRITSLKIENEALRTEAENGKAEAELRIELEQLQKRYDAVEKRRQELAQNNQSLGGRVAHTKRYKQQRDEAKALVEQQQQIATLIQEHQQLCIENERLCQELKRSQ
jgi:regulator of replication initiation timing